MNRFIIADATKCIGCRTCEVACAVSHQENQDCAALSPDEFISRIRVIKDHSWTTAVACHQCEDAPCANVCPVDAISREHGHIFVEQSRCIGCKSCMLACPFGAMEVWNDQLIIQTGRNKSVAQQILANPNVEIVACDGENWMRITAVAKEVTDPAAEEAIYAGYPYMRGVYTVDNPILVLALTNATAVWNPAEGESTTVHF